MSTTTAAPSGTSGASGSEHEASTLRERKKRQTWEAIHHAAVRLVTEHGVAGTTVEAICAEAEVSPRTFFNYFPSKSAAALGLPSSAVHDASRERFLAAEGTVVDDLCDLIAHGFDMPSDRAAIKAMVEERPELAPAMMQWMGEQRTRIVDLVAERSVDVAHARLCVALVFAAFGELMHGGPSRDRTRDETAAALRETVEALRVA
jgi:AcrR family transcriptional regulator